MVEQRLETRAGVDIAASIRADQQHRGAIGAGDQLRDQASALDVAPLRVIDVDHQRLAVADACEQFLERHERASAQVARIARQP
jgi:hypothetical protein